MSKKRSPGFPGKNRGVTPSVEAPGVTHPSDATGTVDGKKERDPPKKAKRRIESMTDWTGLNLVRHKNWYKTGINEKKSWLAT